VSGGSDTPTGRDRSVHTFAQSLIVFDNDDA